MRGAGESGGKRETPLRSRGKPVGAVGFVIAVVYGVYQPGFCAQSPSVRLIMRSWMGSR